MNFIHSVSRYHSHSPEHFYSTHLQVYTHTTNKISSIIEASIWLNSYIPSNYTQSRISIPSDEPCDWPVDQYSN